ncbi:hypothetical protein BGZ52_010143, partial [Haplosporangium bisporale]
MPSSSDQDYSPSSSSSTIIASPAPSYVSSQLPSKLKSFFRTASGNMRKNSYPSERFSPQQHPHQPSS